MLPNFYLLGVPKAGTTALYHMLGQHADVYMSPVKEPQFLAYPQKHTDIDTRAKYERLFDGVDGETIVGEASTDYFHNPETPGRIAELTPEAKMVVVLRDPAERAYSHYTMLVRNGAAAQRPYLEVLREAVGKPEHDLKKDALGAGLKQSFYADALERYRSRFGPDQFHVVFYEAYRADMGAFVRGLYEFMQVRPDITVERQRANTSTQPRSKFLHWLFRRENPVKAAAKLVVPQGVRRRVNRWVYRRNQKDVEPLPPEARAILTAAFREDVERVETILGVDLTAWKR